MKSIFRWNFFQFRAGNIFPRTIKFPTLQNGGQTFGNGSQIFRNGGQTQIFLDRVHFFSNIQSQVKATTRQYWKDPVFEGDYQFKKIHTLLISKWPSLLDYISNRSEEHLVFNKIERWYTEEDLKEFVQELKQIYLKEFKLNIFQFLKSKEVISEYERGPTIGQIKLDLLKTLAEMKEFELLFLAQKQLRYSFLPMIELFILDKNYPFEEVTKIIQFLKDNRIFLPNCMNFILWRIYESQIENKSNLMQEYFDENYADYLSFKLLLKALSQEKKTDTMKKYLQAYLKIVPPFTAAFNTIMDLFKELGELETVLFLFQEMKNRGLQPCPISYSILFLSLAKKKKSEELFSEYQNMKQSGLDPSIVIYRNLIKSFSFLKKWVEMDEIYQDMKKSGCKPDANIFSLVLRVGKYKFSKMLEYWKDMTDLGIEPSQTTLQKVYRLVLLTKDPILERNWEREIAEFAKKKGWEVGPTQETTF